MPRLSPATTRTSRTTRNTRNGPSAMQTRLLSILREARWIAFAALAAWLTLVLATWDSGDPGWSHSFGRDGAAPHNRAGLMGAYIADILLYLFGFSAWWWVVLLLHRVRAGYLRLATQIRTRGEPETLARVRWEQGIGFFMALLGSVGLESYRLSSWGMQLPGRTDFTSGAGGVIGQAWSGFLSSSVGFAGSTLILLALIIFGCSLFFGFSWLSVAEKIGAAFEWVWFKIRDGRTARQDRRAGQVAQAVRHEQVEAKHEKIVHEQPVRIEPAIVAVQASERVQKEKQQSLFVEPAVRGDLPALSLLDQPGVAFETVSDETIEYTSRLIEKKLADFGVEVQVVAAQAGPVITRYEIEPATGVKGSQIVNLAKDLARALSLVSIRVVETIPGKNLMGFELPNPRRQMVKLSEILGSQIYHSSASVVTMALGKDIAGNPVVADLAKMPHLLVAGTTGSGKSVGINAMI
ncbi:DNA translocase FtsK, partial [Zwartia sp.]|uniref:DNA translocase FtsK n=1 Tax=Zwartia sp. TaxID=2978004 RepID=UPI00271AE9ED